MHNDKIKILKLKAFQFKKFTIQQKEEVFRVGTDGVLLGVFCNVSSASSVLEVGTGTGLISLMVAQRNKNAEILAIDINPEAVRLAHENFIASPFSARLQVLQKDFKKMEPNEKFDLVVCNPPFFNENNSKKDVIARQQVALTFRDLIKQSVQVVKKDGILSVIVPMESFSEINSIAEEFNLHLIKKVNICGVEGGQVKRHVLEWSRQKTTQETIDFTIEKSPRKYSDEYLLLTKEFHVFKA